MAESVAAINQREENPSLKWWILLTVIVGTFLGRLDQTIVNLALPKIIGDFGITVTAAGWIATAYILANAIFVPIWGKLGDTLGRKKIYILGFTIFIFGSVLAGLSWNLTSMLVFRIIQAIASSADYPTAMAILTITFPPGKERAQALGIWSSSFAAAIVFGPLLGGPLIDYFGWRSVFMINLPLGILGLVMASIFIRESVSEKKTVNFDIWGALTLGVSLASLVLVLDRGLDWGWFSVSALLCYATIVSFLALFIAIEKRTPEPIIDLKFFAIAPFVNTLLNNFIVFMGMMGGVFLVPIFAQTYLGYTATQSGYLFIPLAFAIMIAAPIGATFSGKVKPQYVIAVSTLGAALGMYLFAHLDPRSTALDIIIPMAVMAFGMGFGMSQRTTIIAAMVPENEIGIASSILALARNIAGAFGIAVFGTILTNVTESNVLSLSQSSSVNIMNPVVYQQAVSLLILKAQVSAYNTVFLVSAVVLLLGAATALLIKVDKERTDVEVFVE